LLLYEILSVVRRKKGFKRPTNMHRKLWLTRGGDFRVLSHNKHLTNFCFQVDENWLHGSAEILVKLHPVVI